MRCHHVVSEYLDYVVGDFADIFSYSRCHGNFLCPRTYSVPGNVRPVFSKSVVII